MSEPPATSRARWAAPLLLALVVALPHLRSLSPGRTVFYRDLGLAPGPILEDARRADDGGLVPLPLWTEGLGEGRPLLANPGNALLAPGSLLYLVLPFEEAFELFLLLHCVLAALGMRALARHLGASEAAGFAAGAAFGLGGFVMSSTNLYPTLAAVAWSPWVALAGLRAGARPTPARLGLLALALAASALGGQPEPVALTALAAAAWGLALTEGSWLRRVGRTLSVWGVAGFWALLLAAPQVLPAALQARDSLRSFGFTTKGLLYNSLDPARLPSFVLPHFGGDPLARLSGGFAQAGLTDSGTPYFVSLYLGLPAVLLALVALFAGRSTPERLRRLRPALALTAAAGILGSLGRHLPGVEALVDALPALAPFRYPVKLSLLAHLAVPLLAAAGLDALRARAAGRARAGLAALLAAVVAGELLVAHAGLAPTVEKDEPWNPVPAAALLQARAAELGAAPGQWRIHHHRRERPWEFSLPGDARTEAELYRRQRRALTPAMGLPMGLDYAMDPSRDLLEPLAQFELARALLTSEGAKPWLGLAELGVLFVLSPDRDLAERSEGVLALDGGLGESFGLKSGEVFVYRNTRWLPRHRLVRPSQAVVRPEASAAELVAALEPSRWPPATVLAEDPGFAGEDAGEPGELRAVGPASSTGRVRLAVRAPAERLLVMADTLTAGWTARVDGEPAPLLRADGAYRAVRVPAGEHFVELRYRPPGLRTGAALAGLGLLLLGLAALRSERS